MLLFDSIGATLKSLQFNLKIKLLLEILAMRQCFTRFSSLSNFTIGELLNSK